MGLEVLGIVLIPPMLLTKYGMMVLGCVKMVFAVGEIIIILEDFLSDRKQRVVSNGQCLSWFDICAGVPQGSILGALLFLIYINDLSNNIKTKCTFFADDTSLFSVVHDIDTSANDLNHGLENISEWAFQWKIKFNPDPTKQTQEIIFSKKNTLTIHPRCLF